MKYLVLCPGSRSGPLAFAAGGLSEFYDLELISSIDERSAAFLALGISAATGKAAAVVTTSGSAVGNLLPAAIEADRSNHPLLLLTADRPHRLKNCGANQTVNQEEFLKPVCRSIELGPGKGFHLYSELEVKAFAGRAWQKCHEFPGPVHCNLHFEEPLHASITEQEEVWLAFQSEIDRKNKPVFFNKEIEKKGCYSQIPQIDPLNPGVIIIGPWRGPQRDLENFKDALKDFQALTGWPIFADPLSGIERDQPGLIYHWELLINTGFSIPDTDLNIFRIGPLPTSGSLQDWLTKLQKKHILISEGDSRCLDPLGLAEQWSYGLSSWLKIFIRSDRNRKGKLSPESLAFMNELVDKDRMIDIWLGKKLELKGQVTEPSLARWLPRLLPESFSTMLSASSPVRDWITFGGQACFSRRCFGFRGASGIDGTLSLAMGLAIASGPTVLVTGDLALLHDSNGWLFSNFSNPPLIVFLIDNDGGGIFNQLGLDEILKGSFKNLFSMPQLVDFLALADAHNIPYRQISSMEDLPDSLEWAISLKGTVLLRVCTCAFKDNDLRKCLQSGLKQQLHMITKNKVTKQF